MRTALPLLLCAACGIRTPHDVERDYARHYEPARIEPARPLNVKPGTVYRVRFWVDSAYASSQLHWQEHLEALLGHVNDVLGPKFGVQLVSVDVRAWSRRTDDEELEGVLQELARLDPGDGVDWVIGLVAPLRFVTPLHHKMGIAEIPGHHFVLRGIEDAVEVREFEAAFTRLYESEKEGLYRRRKAHKELSIFLHEWAHTLGAIHATDAELLLFPHYDLHQSIFGDSTEGLVRIGLEHFRDASQGKPAHLWRDAAAEYLSSSPHPDLVPGELWHWQSAGPGSGDGGVPLPRGRPIRKLSQDEEQVLVQAGQLIEHGTPDEAFAQLQPVARNNPDDARTQRLVCEAQLARHAPARESIGQCTWAMKLNPGAVALACRVAAVRLELESAGGARGLLRGALEAARKDPSVAPDDWVRLARMAQHLELVSVAEDAAALAGPDAGVDELPDWASQSRRELGLPKGALATRAQLAGEGELVEGLRHGFEQVEAGKVEAPLLSAARLQRDYPQVPGPWALSCAAFQKVGLTKEARESCAKALALSDEVVPAHVALALLAQRRGGLDEMHTHFERALALDSAREALWQVVLSAYKKSHRDVWAADLRARFAQRFGKAPPG